MKLRLSAIFAALVALASPAFASSAAFQPTVDVTALTAYGAASGISILHAHVIANNGNYDWNPASTAICDGFNIVCATGVSTGRWILEPITAPLGPLSIANSSGTTPSVATAMTGNTAGSGYILTADPVAIDAAAGRFTMTTETFPGINLPASSRNDTVTIIGYNLTTAGVREKLTEPAMGCHWENFYVQGGVIGNPPQMEFFCQFTSQDGIITTRPIGFAMNRDGTAASAEMEGTTIALNDWGANLRLFFDFSDPAQTVVSLPLSTVFHFAKNDTCPIAQLNFAMSAFDCLIQLNASDQLQFDRPFAGLTGPLSVTAPTLTGGSAALSLSAQAGSTQAIGELVSLDASVTLDNSLQNTGTGLARNVIGATANDAYNVVTDGTKSWSFGIDHSDNGALVASLGTVLGTSNALRIDPVTLAMSGASGVVSQNQCSANTGSTNNSASGSGSFVLMTPNCSLPANAITSGRSFIVYVTFQTTTGSAPPGFHWELRAGSTVLAHFDPVTMTASQTSRTVTYAVKLQGTAAPGAAAPVIAAAITGPNQTNGSTGGSNATAQPVNLATNGALTFQAATLWDTAGTGTNTITLLDMTVQWLN